MNQEDYKAIAEITKEWFHRRGNSILDSELTIKLADYFEKADNKRVVKITHKQPEAYKLFDREQFLKDCGVL